MKKANEATPIRSEFPVIAGIREMEGFMRFVEWASTPKHLRKPKYQKDFAKAIGVHQDTLTDWKKHPQFFSLVQARLSIWIKDRIPDVIGALYESASTEGKAGTVKLFLQLAGIGIEKPAKK